MTRIDLNDLPRWSPWPARLLGLSPWDVPSRTIAKVDREYDKDKYAECLAYYMRTVDKATPDAVMQFQFGSDPESRVCISRNNELLLISMREARSWYYDLLCDTMCSAIGKSASIVELGCGYGYNLWMLSQRFPSKKYWGGEYSSNAVRLASRLYDRNPAVTVTEFNFYQSVYELFERVEPPVTLFTVHAIEQLPSASQVFDALLRCRDKIGAAFHFEPVYELHDGTLLGLMRRRYAEMNDYNRDTLSQLQRRREHIRIVRAEAEVLGLNPLNPTSVIQWEFIA